MNKVDIVDLQFHIQEVSEGNLCLVAYSPSFNKNISQSLLNEELKKEGSDYLLKLMRLMRKICAKKFVE